MKEYRNEHIIVHWYPELCSHPGTCLRLLPKVFNLEQRPWVNVDAAEPEEIIRAIDQCPSGALRYSLPKGSKVNAQRANGVGNLNYEDRNPSEVKIKVCSNGPLLVEGSSLLIGIDGKVLKEGGRIALCRCGYSENRPFCDGVHSKKGWAPDRNIRENDMDNIGSGNQLLPEKMGENQ
ncbi:(4Fe-4S)-binding protein [Desulfosporosinus hippei]|uniref:Uncharacterized Fe-S cluster protein YjdI n=1 Tax=Desulfosporosinus hippei DSM 8344 TaxID=1121419 RepID=A0A1G8JFG3_9FIRM|nr:(4Fe-4S)-binding protein [Desulfosporosinus hippei]SDI29783.1 Uncharacterized Fe-S cluster protein YjdI [Desulfosporosinus hippei DSM 8344]